MEAAFRVRVEVRVGSGFGTGFARPCVRSVMVDYRQLSTAVAVLVVVEAKWCADGYAVEE